MPTDKESPAETQLFVDEAERKFWEDTLLAATRSGSFRPTEFQCARMADSAVSERRARSAHMRPDGPATIQSLVIDDALQRYEADNGNRAKAGADLASTIRSALGTEAATADGGPVVRLIVRWLRGSEIYERNDAGDIADAIEAGEPLLWEESP